MFNFLLVGGINLVDQFNIVSMAITALATVFVWWIKSTTNEKLNSYKLETKEELTDLRNMMEDKIFKAFDGKFVPYDVYRADKETENQRFKAMQEVLNIKLDAIGTKQSELMETVRELKK